ERVAFSEIANQEIARIAKVTQEFMALVIGAMETGDKTIFEQAQQLEDAIDALEEGLRNNHIRRLNTGECTVDSGLVFIDMLHNFEKIGDHSFNLAQAVVGRK
ncbi:MAG TPA: PhoU domain-containing protein, partial [Desulfuromonadales bacterium]|nr:PhoU domain-containing protein [Desulfuromonadales bacterium]